MVNKCLSVIGLNERKEKSKPFEIVVPTSLIRLFYSSRSLLLLIFCLFLNVVFVVIVVVVVVVVVVVIDFIDFISIFLSSNVENET